MSIDPDGVREAMANAVSTALPGEMVTRWVAIVETIDDEGVRALWLQAAEGQKSWDTLGLLRYADHLEAASIVRDVDG